MLFLACWLYAAAFARTCSSFSCETLFWCSYNKRLTFCLYTLISTWWRSPLHLARVRMHLRLRVVAFAQRIAVHCRVHIGIIVIIYIPVALWPPKCIKHMHSRHPHSLSVQARGSLAEVKPELETCRRGGGANGVGGMAA